MKEHPLTKTAVLAHLHICRWSGEVKDKQAVQLVAKAAKAEVGRDKYLKSLFVDNPIGAIDLIVGRLRNHFYDASLAWLDGGRGRLIPVDSFTEFYETYLELRDKFFEEVNHFLDHYEDHKRRAKTQKGELFNEHEYPPVEELRPRFTVTLLLLPFPNTGDFRLQASSDVIQQLEDHMQDSMHQVAQTITAEVEERFVKRLLMLQKALTRDKRFKASLLAGLRSVTTMGLRLEKTLDPALLKRLKKAEELILPYSAKQIRGSVSLREDLVNQCGALL